MTISVCVPTCNRPSLLLQAIHSCLSQTRQPSEILIGDDSDDSESKAAEQAIAGLPVHSHLRIRFLKNRPKLGQNANVDNLFRLATSTHTLLLHDDDLLLPNALEDLAGCWDKFPSLTGAFGKQYVMSSTGQIDLEASEGLMRSYFKDDSFGGLQPESWRVGLSNQFPNDAYLVQTSAATQIGYRSAAEVGDAGDYDFGLRLTLRFEGFFFVPKYTASYRVTQSSVSSSTKNDAALFVYRMLENLELPTYANAVKSTRLKMLSRAAVRQAALLGHKPEARKIFWGQHHPWTYRVSPGGIRRLLACCT